MSVTTKVIRFKDTELCNACLRNGMAIQKGLVVSRVNDNVMFEATNSKYKILHGYIEIPFAQIDDLIEALTKIKTNSNG